MVGGRTKDKDCGFDHHRGEHSSDDLRPPQHDFSIFSFEAQVIGVEYGTDLDRRENVAGTQVPPKWCDAFSAANAKVFGAHGGTNVYTLMQPPPLKEICS
ncbi:unnamed protein product [Mesocestoides corti]|uniref:Uncharacterized protein n=1 Tax=Mesocestoides corti TaxID=53468 RepID=A0A0R3UDN7_MESCO|nr:unnamed protein product [Mesocestoides corti]